MWHDAMWHASIDGDVALSNGEVSISRMRGSKLLQCTLRTNHVVAWEQDTRYGQTWVSSESQEAGLSDGIRVSLFGSAVPEIFIEH